MWQESDDAQCLTALNLKGEEIQKLSLLQTLPDLLATDTQACMTRVIPKMRQSLPAASTEFHIAAAATFKTILEQNLISHSVFGQTFLQSILSSLDSRDQVVIQAWLETLLHAIELLPVEIIRSQILGVVINKGQLAQPLHSKIISCKLLGKICTRFDADMIQKEVLPIVHSLCQDVNSDVRANMCLQLHHVAKGLRPEFVKPALLPSLVELSSDEESSVRFASVQTIANIIPQLEHDILVTIIVPLVKKLCDNAYKADDDVICIIAHEYGNIITSLQGNLTSTDRAWFLKFFQQLAQIGITASKKELKHDIHFVSGISVVNERFVNCRKACAYNIPAMFNFASSSSDDTDALMSTFSALVGDPYYLVRRTIACGIHEVAKILGPKVVKLKSDVIKLLKDNSEDVLQGLVPKLGLIIKYFHNHRLISQDKTDGVLMDLGKALLKCEAEIAGTNNWRLSTALLEQLEILPTCISHEFIYSYFVPIAFKRVMKARPLPIRLAAGRLYLIFLKYNTKVVQRTELRNRIYNDLCNNPDSYVRMLFVRLMVEALSIFPPEYFKEHFFLAVLNLAEDPIANIRLKVVSLMPQMKSQLKLPKDKDLVTAMETTLRRLSSDEDKDVKEMLANVILKLEDIDVRIDSQISMSKTKKLDFDRSKKQDDAKKIRPVGKPFQTSTEKKSPGSATRGKVISEGDKTMGPAKVSNSVTRASSTKTSTSSNTPTSSWPRFTPNRSYLTHPSEKITCSNSSVANDSESGICSGYVMQNHQCSNSKLSVFDALVTLPNTYKQEYKTNISRYCSCQNFYSEYMKSRNQYTSADDCYPYTDFTTSLSLINSRNSRSEVSHNSLLTREFPTDFRCTNSSNKDKLPDLAALRALTNAAHYNSCWAFSSMPEIPVTLSDDEFLVDAGIKMPVQMSSENISKIPNWQDIFDKRRVINSFERSRRSSLNFDKGKLKKTSSIEYEDCMKLRTANNKTNNERISVDYEEGLRRRSLMKENFDDRQYMSDSRIKRYSAPQDRERYGFESNQMKSLDDRPKRNSLILDKEKPKPLYSRSVFQKYNSTSYNVKLPESKDTKKKTKRHSLEVTDYSVTDRFSRALRRYSTLDVNHNQGLSKIPLRSSIISGSRTAPATRASSPIRSQLRFDMSDCENIDGSSIDKNLTRFSSSNEEVYKLCQKFLDSEMSPSRSVSLKIKDSKLPIRLQRNKN